MTTPKRMTARSEERAAPIVVAKPATSVTGGSEGEEQAAQPEDAVGDDQQPGDGGFIAGRADRPRRGSIAAAGGAGAALSRLHPGL